MPQTPNLYFQLTKDFGVTKFFHDYKILGLWKRQISKTHIVAWKIWRIWSKPSTWILTTRRKLKIALSPLSKRLISVWTTQTKTFEVFIFKAIFKIPLRESISSSSWYFQCMWFQICTLFFLKRSGLIETIQQSLQSYRYYNNSSVISKPVYSILERTF